MKTKVCKKCKTEKPLDEFGKNVRKRDGKSIYCKKCSAENTKKYRKENPDKVKEWNRGPGAKIERRKYRWKRRGIDCNDELYNSLFNEQQGCCAVCGTHQSKLKKALGVDHNHISGEVRGLLCGKCNTGIGYFQVDSEGAELLLKAMEYIQK